MNTILLVASWTLPAAAQVFNSTAPPAGVLAQPATSVVVTTGTLAPTATGVPGAPFNSPGAPLTQPLPPSPYNQPGAPFNPPPAPGTTPPATPTPPPPGAQPPERQRQGKRLKPRPADVETALRALDEQNFESRRELSALFDRRKKALTDSEDWIAASRHERKLKLKELKAELRQLEERLRQRYRVIRAAIVRDGRDRRDKEIDYESRL
jgi:hypothetical protein